MPLATPDGQNLGTLCVMDRIPRQLSAGQREALGRLGRQVMNQMELRLTNRLLATASTDLREMEERSRALVETTPNAIVMVNEEGRITLVNSQAELLFGYSRDELLDQPVEMLAPERYRKENFKDGGGFFGGAEPGAIADFTGLRKNGTEVPIEVSLRALPTSAGNATLASITNVTARKRNGDQISRLRHDLKQKRQQLERANRELADLTSTVSHDLMTPLRGISSLANWLVTSYSNRLDGSGREQLNLLALKVRRLNVLVDGLLTDPPRNRPHENRALLALKLAATPSPSNCTWRRGETAPH